MAEVVWKQTTSSMLSKPEPSQSAGGVEALMVTDQPEVAEVVIEKRCH
jgi:hypothetical protein